MLRKTPLASAISSITVAGAIAAGGAALPAYAADEMLEEVVVTGSRIRRADFTSNAPVATIGFEQIDLTGTVNAESLLNTMPQMIPGLDRTSNNPGNGTATVNLRGLGAQRTLVLINGTRMVPTDQGGFVDINNVPTALIDKVEVLTGGASAIYGTDAVAGVVNFILKDDFEGVQFNLGSEQTEEGDATINSADLTIGANTGDGRGNVVLNMSWTDREELFQGDRDFANFAQFDGTDSSGNPILYNGGSPGIPETLVFAGNFPLFNQDGTIRPFVSTGDPNDYYNYAPVNYIQLPQERYQATALASYEFSDAMEAYGRLMFTSSNVPQQLAPTPAYGTFTWTLDGNPYIDDAAEASLSGIIGDGVDTDGDGIDDTATAFIGRRMLEVGPRIVDSRFTSWQVKGGLRGDIGATSWSYDAYLQQGSVSGSFTQYGNINTDRFQQALLLDLATDPTGGTCVDPGSNGAPSGCSPINIFGRGNISQAGADFVNTAVAAAFEYDQDVYSLTFSGDLMQLPGGNAGAAFGFEHIDQSADFRPSQDLAAGTIAGFNGQPPAGGGYRLDSYFGEVYLPLITGAPMAEEISLELAARSSDYTTIGGVDSYKIAGSWSLNDTVRFRAGFNTAVRAASIAELFTPLGENFPGADDPCSADGNPTAAVAAICTATGVPSAAVGTAAINTPAGQVRELQGGNPDLKEEEAETLTAGVVVTNLVDGLTFSLDYFDIQIDDAISSFGGGANNVLTVCYDPTDPAGGVGSDFCNVVHRRSNGLIEYVEVTQQNVAEITLSGWDLLASYDTELMGGSLRVAYVGTFTDESDLVPYQGGTPITCAGEFGLDCGEPTPEYKHRITFNWARDNLTAQVLWRYIGETTDDDPSTTYYVETIDGENYFDAVMSYQFTENYSVNFGIDNLLDTDPPILGDNQEQSNTYPATYDVFGRTYYFKATARF